jgi:hypothetical protein
MQIFVADLTLLKFLRCATNSIFRKVRSRVGRVGKQVSCWLGGGLEELICCSDSVFNNMSANM